MEKPTGIRRLLLANRYSWLGLKAAWRTEAAIRQEVIGLVIVLPVAFYLPIGAAETALLVFSAVLVLIVELINTAIEAVVDRMGPDYHALSGKAKDVGSAAVLVALINAVVVWAIIVWPLI